MVLLLLHPVQVVLFIPPLDQLPLLDSLCQISILQWRAASLPGFHLDDIVLVLWLLHKLGSRSWLRVVGSSLALQIQRLACER